MPRSSGKVVLCEAAQYMRTARGGCKLVLSGFVYRIKQKTAGREYYSCDSDCNATVVVKNGVVRSRRGTHNHGPEEEKIRHMVPIYDIATDDPLDPLSCAEQTDENCFESGGSGMMDEAVAGPSGYGDDVRVKMEPEWVDAGALEPNCELEGQYEDTPDYNAGYSDDALSSQDNQNYQMFSGQQQQETQSLPLIPDSQDPVKLRVPGKPNLTITVAPTRQAPTHSSPPLSAPPPLHLLNPLMNRKRGRPRGSQYGSYSESDDRVTTILTDSIIASQKLEKMGASAFNHPKNLPNSIAAAMSATLASRVKPRSKDPEAVRAAEIVNNTQNRSGPRVTEELEKVHLKLRQEVLALEVQNLKAEREKLRAYRRNVSIRREIMILHLRLGKGIPSECASSGRGLETVDPSSNYFDMGHDDFSRSGPKEDFSNTIPKEPISMSKTLPDVSISQSQPSQSPKISIRKSLQSSNPSPNASPLSNSSNTKCVSPPPVCVNKPLRDLKEISGNRQQIAHGSEEVAANKNRQQSEGNHHSDNLTMDLSENRATNDFDLSTAKVFGSHSNNSQMDLNRGSLSSSSCQQSVRAVEPGKDDLVPLDSVSSDLSIELLSEPGSSQWTNQSSAPMTEHEGFDDLQFEGDDSYDNTDNIGEFSGGSIDKEPPDAHFSSYSEESAQKRRKVDNMWEPDGGPL